MTHARHVSLYFFAFPRVTPVMGVRFRIVEVCECQEWHLGSALIPIHGVSATLTPPLPRIARPDRMLAVKEADT